MIIRFYHILFLLFSPILIVAESSKITSTINSTVTGQVKLFSYDIDKQANEDDAFATALGGYLKYSTDLNKSIYATVTFHASIPIGSNENRDKTALFNNDNNAEAFIVNSEAFIGWRSKYRVLKLGNLMLNTPMMNVDTTRIVPWSYQGGAYTGEAIANTKVQLYHINKIRSHTSNKYTKQSASGNIDSGITMLGLEYVGLKGFDIQSYYYYAEDLYSTFIAQFDYSYLLDKNNLICASMQYFKSGNGGKYAQTDSRLGGDDIDLVALRLGYDSEDFDININYSQNFGISGIIRGYGGLAKVLTSSMIANGRGNYKPETWMLKSSYNFHLASYGESEFALNLTHTRTHDNRGDDFDAIYLHFKQRFNINTTLFVRFENIDHKKGKGDANYLRVIASYNF